MIRTTRISCQARSHLSSLPLRPSDLSGTRVTRVLTHSLTSKVFPYNKKEMKVTECCRSSPNPLLPSPLIWCRVLACLFFFSFVVSWISSFFLNIHSLDFGQWRGGALCCFKSGGADCYCKCFWCGNLICLQCFEQHDFRWMSCVTKRCCWTSCIRSL